MRKDSGVDGFLVIDKPAGMTSHDVIGRLRRLLGTRRIGHAGTLDPMATGVLLVGVGRATRLLGYTGAESKEYRAIVRFGSRTTTLDAEGEATERASTDGVTRDTVEAALEGLRGEIEQIPPMVSAIKIGGERLHQKARRGEEVDRPPRRVTIFELELEGFEPGYEPEATMRVVCSPGTYIRTLADDLGVAVGSLAHLAWLRRTRNGPWRDSDAVQLEDVSVETIRPIEDAVAALPRIEVDAKSAQDLRHGKQPDAAGFEGPWAAVGPEGIVAICQDGADGARILVGIPPAPGES